MTLRSLKYASFWILCLCMSIASYAQDGLEEGTQILQPDELLQEDLNGNGNETYIQQVGDFNQVDLMQIQQGNESINLAKLLQKGDYNVIVISQEGKSNIAWVRQEGNNNFYELDLSGNNNNIGILQRGEANNVVQDLIDTEDVNIKFIQVGNNNQIVNELDGIKGREYKVTQIGDNMQIEIKRSSF